MALIGELLFHKGDLSHTLRCQLERLRATIDGLAEKTLTTKSDSEIADMLISDFQVEPIDVHIEKAEAKVEECETELRDNFRFNLPNGPVIVPGLKASKSIPFSGDPELWKHRPNSYTLSPPRGEVRGNMLVIGITVHESQSDEAKRHIDSTIEQLPTYLGAQERQIKEYNAQISADIPKLILQRRSRLSAASDLLKKLQG